MTPAESPEPRPGGAQGRHFFLVTAGVLVVVALVVDPVAQTGLSDG